RPPRERKSESSTKKTMAMSIAYSRMFVPLSAAVAGGLAAAAGERVGLGAALCGADVGDAAATVCVGVSERVAVGTAVAAGVDAARVEGEDLLVERHEE